MSPPPVPPSSLHLAIAQPNPDGSFPVPTVPGNSTGAATASASAAQWEERATELQTQIDGLQAVLAQPLNDILAERDKAQDTAAAWDSFGAMWMLSQRAMRRVALDLAAQLGVSESDVVARAMQHANAVLNGDGVDLGGTIAAPQLEHIARHRAFLRKQFRSG